MKATNKAVLPPGIQVQTSSPPPPRPPSIRSGTAAIYKVAAGLRVGEWFEWAGAPATFRKQVERWAKIARVPGLCAYRDMEGTVIVRRRGEDEYLEPDEMQTQVLDDEDDEDAGDDEEAM